MLRHEAAVEVERRDEGLFGEGLAETGEGADLICEGLQAAGLIGIGTSGGRSCLRYG